MTCQQGLRLLCKTLHMLQRCRRWEGSDIESSGVEDFGSMSDPQIVKRGSLFFELGNCFTAFEVDILTVSVCDPSIWVPEKPMWAFQARASCKALRRAMRPFKTWRVGGPGA